MTFKAGSNGEDDRAALRAERDALAAKLAEAEKRAEAIQQYASDDHKLAETYRRERDARYPLSPARYAELIAAEARAAALAQALRQIADAEAYRQEDDHDLVYYQTRADVVGIARAALAGNGNGNEWTACADRMPADGEHVMIYEAGEIGSGPEASVYHAGRWWGKILTPTHWKPVGPLPGESA